jgi:hypothetical protein
MKIRGIKQHKVDVDSGVNRREVWEKDKEQRGDKLSVLARLSGSGRKGVK